MVQSTADPDAEVGLFFTIVAKNIANKKNSQFREFMRMWRGAIGEVGPIEEAKLMIQALKKMHLTRDIVDKILNHFPL